MLPRSALVALFGALAVAGQTHECPSFESLRQASVLPLTGTNIYSLDGLWYTVGARDPTQPPYLTQGCSCTHYNMTVQKDGSFKADDLWKTTCVGPDEPLTSGTHFKGHFVPTEAGRYNELWAYNATTQVNFIDYPLIAEAEGGKTVQSAIRFMCRQALWTLEFWSRSHTISQSAVTAIIDALPHPFNTGFRFYNNTGCPNLA